MLWRRYFREGLALLILLATRVLPYAWYLRRHRAHADRLATASVEAKKDEQHYVVRLRGTWTQRNIVPLRDCFSKAILAGNDVRLEMEEVKYVDSAFVGLIMLLQSHQTQHGRKLRIVSPQEPVRRVIKYCCAEYLCDSGTSENEGIPRPMR